MTTPAKSAIILSSILFTSTASADVVEIIALEGDSAPGGGVYVINGVREDGSLKGDYASFTARRDDAVDNDLVLVTNKQNSAINVVFEGGSAVDGAHTIDDNSLHSSVNTGVPVVNANGEVIAYSINFLTSNANATKIDLLAGDNTGYVGSVLFEDEVEPSGDGMMRMPTGLVPTHNASGTGAASVRLSATSGGATDDEAIYSWQTPTGTLTEVVRKGNTLPSGPGTFTGTEFQSNEVFDSPFINETGDIAFIGGVSGGVSGESSGIFFYTGGTLIDYIRYNDALPNSRFFAWSRGIDINNAGQVAFSANVIGTSSSTDGVYRTNGSSVTEIASSGQTSPNGSPFRTFQNAVKVAESGMTIFASSLTETGTPNAVFIGDGSTTTMLAKEDNPAPESRGNFQSFSRWQISPNGNAIFQATTTLGFEAIYRYDGAQIIEAVSTADILDGSLITDLSIMGSDDAQAIGVNNDADILFGFRLANGKDGIALWRTSLAPEPPSETVPMLPIGALVALALLLGVLRCKRV